MHMILRQPSGSYVAGTKTLMGLTQDIVLKSVEIGNLANCAFELRSVACLPVGSVECQAMKHAGSGEPGNISYSDNKNAR